MVLRSHIHVTSQDLERLERLVASAPRSESILALEERLQHAVVVAPAAMPKGVATVGSTVRYHDEDTGEEETVTIVYPLEADLSLGCVSVLAPLGSALLGLSSGDRVEWPIFRGRSRRLRVTAVGFPSEVPDEAHA